MPVLLCLPPLLLLLPQDIEAGARRSASTQALNKLARSRNASTVSLSGLNELANGGSPNGAPVNGAANGAANGHLAAAAKALGEGEHKSADDSAAESTPGGSPKKTVKPAAGNGYRLTNSSPKSSAAPTPALPGALAPAADSSARRWVGCVGRPGCKLSIPALPRQLCGCAWPRRPPYTAFLARQPWPPLPFFLPSRCSKLPFEPLSVTFKNICYDVPRPKSSTGEKSQDTEVGADTLRLLRHVSGAFRPGVLTALMGASGAGGCSVVQCGKLAAGFRNPLQASAVMTGDCCPCWLSPAVRQNRALQLRFARCACTARPPLGPRPPSCPTHRTPPAGKTTLMDVLAGRKTGGVASGEVHVNGFPKNQKTFARVAGYCEQEDVHLPTATVAEALAFSATLRLPSTVSAETRNEFIEEVGGWVGGWGADSVQSTLLAPHTRLTSACFPLSAAPLQVLALTELDRLRHAYIGDLGVSGLSVEQRKRLTIGVELVANPSIVFME